MSLKFRNLTVTPADPVGEWGFEGLLTAVDRGEVSDWARIVAEVDAAPFGEVAALLVTEVFAVAADTGVVAALRRCVDQARERLAERERAEVATRVRAAVADAGLSRAAFAARVGTSASRLSTYENGKVTPSATLLLRMERVAAGRPTI